MNGCGWICFWLVELTLLGSRGEVVKEGWRPSGGYREDVYNEDSLARYVWEPGPLIYRCPLKKVIGSVAQYGTCTRWDGAEKNNENLNKWVARRVVQYEACKRYVEARKRSKKYHLLLFSHKLLGNGSIYRYVYEMKCKPLGAMKRIEESGIICKQGPQKELLSTIFLFKKTQLHLFSALSGSVRFLEKYLVLEFHMPFC